MIIMCDIDNILNDLIVKAITLYNTRSGKNIKISDITSYHLSDCLSQEDAKGICSLFKEKELWDSLKPLSGAQKGLKTLINKGHTVYLATATDPTNFEWKCKWCNYYFDFIPTDNIIRIVNKSLLKVDVLIDDYLDNLIYNICDRIVLDYTWNRDTSKDYAYDIQRAHNWEEIVHIINDIERKNKEWEKM